MVAQQKPPSPFVPNQPVPVDLFVGRNQEFARIQRSANEVAGGKQDAVFLVGDYGIGKTSLARYSAEWAKTELKLFPIHVLLGGAKTLDQVSEKTVQTVLRTDAFDPTAGQKVKNFLAKYVGEQEIFGFKVNLQTLQQDLPNITKGYGGFLHEVFLHVREAGYVGIFLIFDEVNGIAGDAAFAHFIKTLIDENALASEKTPLLLMLCGTERVRHQIIANHQPVERIFKIAEMSPLKKEELVEFFEKAFSSVGVTTKRPILDLLAMYSGGLPKLAHIIGDEVYYSDVDGEIDPHDTITGLLRAAEEVGRKFIDPKVYDAIKSDSYKKILQTLVAEGFRGVFRKEALASKLDPEDRRKLDNFLHKMKELNVLVPGSKPGEYQFSDYLTELYVHLRQRREIKETAGEAKQ